MTGGNEKVDGLVKEGGMLDGRDLAQVRAVTVQEARDEAFAALQCAAGFHCLVEEELRRKPK